MSMNLSASMPNLPGMAPDRTSWLHRQGAGGGFGRVVTFSRPSSGISKKKRGVSATLPYPMESNQLLETGDIARPSTAGNMRSTAGGSGIDFLRDLSASRLPRPHTAGPTYGAGFTQSGVQWTQTPVKELEKEILVCRFYAHFNQDRPWEKNGPLGDPVVENAVPRRLTILYYLKDDTIEMSEPKVVNSGMPNGKFFRRGQLYKEGSDEKVSLRDIIVGSSFHALGQEFYVTDADAFTRKYYEEELGIKLKPAVPRPAVMRRDLGAQYATGMGSQVAALKTKYGSRSTDYLTTKEELMKTNSFFKYDGRVLKFLCVEVAGLDPPYFPALHARFGIPPNKVVADAGAKQYALSYYLSNNTVELMIQKKRGVTGRQLGYDEPKLVVKKSKLPRNWRAVQRGQPPELYEMSDLFCGNVVDVFGRYFLLVTCDHFTKLLYQDMGVMQQDVQMIAVPTERVVHPLPQRGDGFLPIGSEADTLGTVYGMPKPTKDVHKLMRNQNRVVRCKAAFLSSDTVDSTRQFLITYFMEDDTIQIYEDNKRNSGIVGGNFLKRGKYTNYSPPDGAAPREFIPTDMFLGNVLTLVGVSMKIIEMDNMTLRFCENYPEEFPMMDTFKILNGLVQKLIESKLDLREYFVRMDNECKGWVTQGEFVNALDGLGLIEDLNDQEVLTILRRFKTGDQYDYEELCDLASHIFFNRVLEGSATRAEDAMGAGDATKDPELTAFFVKLRSRNNQWRRMLNKELSTHDGTATLAVLHKFFAKYGISLTEGTLHALYSRYNIPQNAATPTLKVLEQKKSTKDVFGGFSQKVQPMPQQQGKNGRKKHTHSIIHTLTNTAPMGSPTRKRSLLIGNNSSSLLDNSSHMENGDSTLLPDGSLNLSGILIDYRRLCDDVYVSDWV